VSPVSAIQITPEVRSDMVGGACTEQSVLQALRKATSRKKSVPSILVERGQSTPLDSFANYLTRFSPESSMVVVLDLHGKDLLESLLRIENRSKPGGRSFPGTKPLQDLIVVMGGPKGFFETCPSDTIRDHAFRHGFAPDIYSVGRTDESTANMQAFVRIVFNSRRSAFHQLFREVRCYFPFDSDTALASMKKQRR
jgi:hypothetical protein